MLARFEGDDGKRRLVDLLSRQMALAGMAAVADELAGLVAVRAVPAQAALIQQDGDDNDLYFVLSGRVSVQVHGREVAVRGPGDHVGEMAMIDPAAKRCANVVAIDDTVVAAVTEAQFTDLAQRNPHLWRMLALELGNRLRQRNALVTPKNPRPALFIGSSAEALPIVRYPNKDYVVRQSVGVDTSDLFVARTGVRGANDLVWVGPAANYAAKLCSLRTGDYASWITAEVYNVMIDDVKTSSDGRPMWEAHSWTAMGGKSIYRSSWRWVV